MSPRWESPLVVVGILGAPIAALVAAVALGMLVFGFRGADPANRGSDALTFALIFLMFSLAPVVLVVAPAAISRLIDPKAGPPDEGPTTGPGKPAS